MPKLLQINVSNNVFSTGKIVNDIGDIAIANGWESYIAYGRLFAPGNSVPIKIGTKWDNYIHGIETRIFDNHCLGLASRRATKKLVEQIEIIKPDIIQIFVLAGYYINMKVLFRYLAKKNIPVVFTICSCWDFTGHCTHYTYEKCDKWKNGCHHCPLKKEYPESFVFDRSRKNYDEKNCLFHSIKNLTLIVPSEWLREQVEQSFLSDCTVKVINFGIDVDVYKPSNNTQYLREKYGLGNKFVAIGVASAWTEKKGLYDYYDLANILPDDVQLIMVGLNDDQLAELPRNIIGIKKTSNRQELIDLYTMSDAVLNLSYEETFGLTPVEGMACGTPAIVYNITANPELIAPETGIVVEPGDIPGIVSALKEIQSKGKFAYSSCCRQSVEKRFNKYKNFETYFDLYKELINKKVQ